MRLSSALVFLVALALALVSVAGSAAAQLDPDAIAWRERCESLRLALTEDPNVSVTYGERPDALPMAEMWTLRVHGFDVPVPAGTYNDVIVAREGDEPVSVILVGQRQTALIVASMQIEPLHDIFAGIGLGGAPITSEENAAWTRELFHGPVDLAELTDLGYRHAPSELTCGSDAWRTEIPMALAMILKGAGPGRLVRVFRPPGEGLGWLTQREAEGQAIWEASRVEAGRVWFVNLSGPATGPVRDLGLAIDHPELVPTSEPPEWLGALERALAADDSAEWQSFADVLLASGLTVRSVEAARAVAATAP
jgi:hypothetical protein